MTEGTMHEVGPRCTVLPGRKQRRGTSISREEAAVPQCSGSRVECGGGFRLAASIQGMAAVSRAAARPGDREGDGIQKAARVLVTGLGNRRVSKPLTELTGSSDSFSSSVRTTLALMREQHLVL
ncbi:hypothetical protein E2562_038121 [Oryza meyeriana var. granulata]|uniref:Uncharacterized protein n=1 Tax=Oryza meyeriana var. granulata TaxID=110450 RepID=A0A6G1C1I1_9ORYZ|nr:hypothetical protein E2562_038121 [Oryza meyeriana var. granulata]